MPRKPVKQPKNPLSNIARAFNLPKLPKRDPYHDALRRHYEFSQALKSKSLKPEQRRKLQAQLHAASKQVQKFRRAAA